MPLLDHFHPPLSQRRHWDSFHGAWAEAIAGVLNSSLLPPRYFAEARVTVGPRVEIDVSTFAEGNGHNGHASEKLESWVPPPATAKASLAFGHPELFEVQVLNDDQGPRVVAALELVSPANKDRPSHRHMFAVKCASYLQQGIGLIIVDVVTERRSNLHAELLQLLNVTAATPAQGLSELYGVAYRAVAPEPAGDLNLEMWVERLALGSPLPTLPLWLGPDLCIPVDLDKTYLAACEARRIT